MKKKKETIRVKPKLMMMTMKLKRNEYLALRLKAELHTDGNLSAWLRQAGLEYMPK